MMVTKATHMIHGGLHLDEQKAPACDYPIRNADIADQFTLPLNMHAGVDAIPVVTVGQHVSRGQLVASADGNLSANIHSPVNGIVSAIEPRPMSSRSGFAEMAIVIDGKDSAWPVTDTRKWVTALSETPQAIYQAIQQAGIVGLGGAGFPTAVKVAASNEAKTLLVNGAECEPYICCDDRTMRDFAEEVIAGSFLLAKAANCDFIEIGTEDNKPEAISSMEQVINELPEHMQKRIKIIVCPTRYPMGGERQLLEAITGKQVPSSTYPAELGYLVQNIGTVLAVFNMMCRDEPLISRMVTITGKAVTNPGVYEVLLGTPIKQVLQQAGLDDSILFKVIHGGPMMGYPVQEVSAPVTKITNCLIAATAEELPPLPEEEPCVRCGKCTEVCPASLLPQQLYWFSKSEEFDKAESHKIHDCIECGLCSFVCPSHIPLVDYYRFAKSEIRRQNEARIKSDRSKIKFDARNERLKQEQLEKARIKAEKAKQRAANKEANMDANRAKQDAVAAALARVKAKKDAVDGSEGTDK